MIRPLEITGLTKIFDTPAGPYTAVVRGANSGTGIGSVEVYQLP